MDPLSASNMTSSNLDAVAFEKLARSRLLASPPLLNEPRSPGDDDLNPEIGRFAAGLRHAAVLVPVIARSPLTVLLTARTEHLPSHAGQIAFPAEKVETYDAGPLAAALREAREEISLDQAFIEPLGYLSPYRTGHRIHHHPIGRLDTSGIQADRRSCGGCRHIRSPVHVFDGRGQSPDS